MAEIWGVLVDDQLGNQLFPSSDFARAAASGIAKQKPACQVEYARLEVVVRDRHKLLRRLHLPGRR